VSVALRVTSPTGAAAICFAGGGPSLDCRTTRTTTFAARADSTHRDFAMSLRGSGDAAPIIDLTLTFPASTPAIMIERARFDGTNDPNLNGLQVIVHPRRGGDVTLDATWGQPYRYEVDLFEQGGDNRSQQFPNQPAASGVQQTFPITGTNPWKLVLQNIDAGNGVTQMTATIGWP
jgi:hypothetical protein